MDAKVYAESVDDIELAGDIAKELSYPVAHGVTREDATELDSW